MHTQFGIHVLFHLPWRNQYLSLGLPAVVRIHPEAELLYFIAADILLWSPKPSFWSKLKDVAQAFMRSFLGPVARIYHRNRPHTSTRFPLCTLKPILRRQNSICLLYKLKEIEFLFVTGSTTSYVLRGIPFPQNLNFFICKMEMIMVSIHRVVIGWKKIIQG